MEHLLVGVLDEELEPSHRKAGDHTGQRSDEDDLAGTTHELSQLVPANFERIRAEGPDHSSSPHAGGV
jgi:hypothetical protein